MTAPRSRRWWIGAAIVAPVLLGASASAAGPVDRKEAVLTPREGNSTTEFSLGLPDGASCPGDSANDGYRVQSYMVPASVDPATVTYNGTGPIPNVYGTYAEFRQPLYDISSNSLVALQTANALAPGEPGPIINVPTFNYAVYGPDDLPAGRYHVGLVCTLSNEIVTVWDTEVVVAEDAGDAPARIHWTAASTGDGAADSPSNLPVAAAVVGAAAAGLTVLALRRRRQHPTTTSLEEA